MSGPLVSVITNCYNSGNYIRANVESVLAQDYSNWEHIVIDCGSTDDSLAILAELDHQALRVIRVPFCSPAEARNIGIEASCGEIIAVLDSDDYALPHRLARQVDALCQRPDVVGVGSAFIRLDESTGREKKFVYPFTHDQLAILLRAAFDPIPHSSLAFRASSYQAVGGYSNTIEKAEDFELLIRLSDYGTLLSLSEPLVRCTHRENSHTKRHRPKGRDTMYYALLGVILNSVDRKGRPPQLLVERWLDKIGSTGISALLGRWSYMTARRNFRQLDRRSLSYLARRTVSNARSILKASREPWWETARTPRDVALQLQLF